MLAYTAGLRPTVGRSIVSADPLKYVDNPISQSPAVTPLRSFPTIPRRQSVLQHRI